MEDDFRTLDHDKLIRDAKSELYYSLKQRRALDTRIGQLNKILRGLASTLPKAERDKLLSHLKMVSRKPAGLTEMIGEVLQNDRGGGLNGTEISEQMESTGFDLSDYSQPLATISNTLARMAEAGKVKRKFEKGRGFAWRWTGGHTPTDSIEIFRPDNDLRAADVEVEE